MLASRYPVRARTQSRVIPSPQTGNITIGFSTTNKWQSRLIRHILNSPCSHAWIAYDSHDFGFRRVLQAEWYGFEDIPWEKWKSKNILVAEFYPTGHDLWPAVQWLARHLGSDYDYKAAALLRFKRFFSTFIKRPFSDPDKLMCSEAVCRALARSGYESFLFLDPEAVDPKECLLTCLKDSKNFTSKWISDSLITWLDNRSIGYELPTVGPHEPIRPR